MSEVLDRAEAEPAADTELSAGAMLRRAREDAGMHRATLAVSLKIPVRKIEALEEDRYDLMTDAVFVRGLASSICRALKIDPQPVLDRLPQTSVPRLPQVGDGLNTPFRGSADEVSPGWIDHVRQPVFLAVIALLLGAVVLILLPAARKDGKPVQAKAESEKAATTTQVAAQAPAAEMPSRPPVDSSPVAAAPAPATPAAADELRTAKAVPSTVVPASAPAAVPKPSVSASAAAPVAGPMPAGVVAIRAKGETWIEVTDARGVAVLRRLLAAGDAVGASGVLPLQVTIGRAQLADVLVRGKPFDMRPLSRDGVAHFEVK